MEINMHDEENPELKLAFGFLQNTGENVFLTGKAGTGKTTFLHNFKKASLKRMIVLAPTGVAAINAKGATIHSFFQMPFGPRIPSDNTDASCTPYSKVYAGNQFHRFNREKLNIIRSLDLLVIDEISMVRADLLDGIDEVLRRFRDHNKPFGGVQLLMIGDLQQLAPVVKDDEWEMLKEYYETPFFFSSKALKKADYLTIELKQIYRQNDQEFIDLLNSIRHGERIADTLAKINKRFIPNFNIESNGGIILTTHNYQAQRINDERMRKLVEKPEIFTADVDGDFPEYSYPTDFKLTLKTGAQVMFVKNDASPDKRYYNGKIGVVQSIDDDVVFVKCTDDNSAIPVRLDTWQNTKYHLNNETKEIEETVSGTFTQYPLKAAWAITIHKSQGLTFDKIIIDAGAAFAHGQVYVALSRCKTLEGLVLTSLLTSRVLINDSSVSEFNKKAQEQQPGEAQLLNAKITYQQNLLRELFNFSLLQRRLSRCFYLMNENNRSIHPSLIDKFKTITANVNNDIIIVAEKFNNQMNQYFLQEADVERNDPLQERIKKACTYFAGKIEVGIRGLLPTTDIDIDNKDARKLITNAIKLFKEELTIKCSCLEVCNRGFSTGTYLEVRAKASIEKPVDKQTFTESGENYSFTKHPDLYETLKSWRAEKASSKDLPHYLVLPHKTILDICTLLPASLTELKAIKGIGSKKLNSFGNELLEIVSQYCSKHSITPEARGDIAKEEISVVKEKQNTKQISFDLFKSGKTIAEIATQRDLTHSTIEGHLSHYIETGELSISQFLPPDKVLQLSDFFITNDVQSLTPAKTHFGDSVSFGELRMVLAHLKSIRSESISELE